MRTAIVRGVLAALVIVGSASGAAAQVFGTFTWQMQPYCNRATLTLTGVNGNFTLDGFDDMCEAAKRGSANGHAVFNPDGTVGLNFTIVTPAGRAVHVAAVVSPANGQGSWTDSVGNFGTFAFFGNVPGLPSRPVPASGLPPLVVTTTELASNAVTGEKVADGSLSSADLVDGPRASFALGPQFVDLTSTAAVVRSVTLDAPTAGTVIVNASGTMRFALATPGQEVAQCSITTDTILDFDHQFVSNDGGAALSVNDYHPFAATRGFNVPAGAFTVNLVCLEFAGQAAVVNSSLSALFVAQ